jgi:hypothetical protein
VIVVRPSVDYHLFEARLQEPGRTTGECMSMLSRLIVPLLVAASPALAHDLPVQHAHPHGDWLGTFWLLVAAGISALFLVRAGRRPRDDDRDPR